MKGNYLVQLVKLKGNENKQHTTYDYTSLSQEERTLVDEYELIYSDVPNANVLTYDDNLHIIKNKKTGVYQVSIETMWCFNTLDDFQTYLTVLKDDMLYKLGLTGKVATENFDVEKVLLENYSEAEVKTYLFKRLEHYIQECMYLYECKQPKCKLCDG